MSPIKLINTPENYGSPSLPFSHAAVFNHLVFLSGTLGIALDGTIPPTFEEQLVLFANMRNALKESGSDLQHVLKITVYLADMNDYNKLNEYYSQQFADGHKPARTCIQVARLPRDARVEMEAIAVAKHQ